MIEYRGEAIRALSIEARMTICNMSIEAGARAGMIAPDETTFAYLQGRPHAPQGADWDAAVAWWRSLVTDDDAVFDTEVVVEPTSCPRSSRGAPTLGRVCRCRAACRRRRTSTTPTSGPLPNGR